MIVACVSTLITNRNKASESNSYTKVYSLLPLTFHETI